MMKIKVLLLILIVFLMVLCAEANYITVEETSDSTYREVEYNNMGEAVAVTEVTVLDDGTIIKFGIRTTDGMTIPNPDEVHFYLTSPNYDINLKEIKLINTDQQLLKHVM